MTEPLFDLPEPKPLRAPKAPIAGEGPIKWTDYRPIHPRKCDDCERVALEGWRDGVPWAPSRQARHKMSQGGVTVAFLCGEHKQIRSGNA